MKLAGMDFGDIEEDYKKPTLRQVNQNSDKYQKTPPSGTTNFQTDLSKSQISYKSPVYVKHISENPYFVVKMNDEGVFENYNPRKQYIIPSKSEVRFQLDYGTKISKNAVLLVNLPQQFPDGKLLYTITQPLSEESNFQEFQGSSLPTDYLEVIEPHPSSSIFMLEYRVFFEFSGSFFVQISYKDDENGGSRKHTKPQYVNVQPKMSARNIEIRSKELRCITVMSRCLGKIDRWQGVLNNIKELGYNAVHFTPFQVYGESFSHYSIANQNEIDDYYFQNPQQVSSSQRMDLLKQNLDELRNKGIVSLVDIVLNHTANNSAWIVDHPDATYNTDDCPHLWSAWVLDKAMQEFSNDFANKKIPECPSAPNVSTEQDLAQVMASIKKRVVEPLKLHEFFLSDVNNVINNIFTPELNKIDQIELQKYKKIFENKGYFDRNHFDLMRDKFTINVGAHKRMGVSLKMPDTAFYFMICHNNNKASATEEVKKLLCNLNDDWMKRQTEFRNEAYGSFEGTIRYYKLTLKKCQVSRNNYMVDPYFTECKNDQKSKVAHNGWIGGHNCMDDFGYVGWHYLRRTINIWGDCIKLRYGQCPADSPYLWEHMTKYVQDMAQVADGFRLDNTHSTPIHVCQYLLQAARSKNPNLFVMAELFTDSGLLDAMFCQKLNLNGLVRELQNRYDTKTLGEYFHQLSCQLNNVGMVDEEFTDLLSKKYKVLMPSNPADIIYDNTHDNPSVVEKFQTGRMALAHIGLSSMADISIASTWGYDFLVNKQIHCVDEKRVYPILDQNNFVTPDQTVYPAAEYFSKAQDREEEEEKQSFHKIEEKTFQQTSFEFEFWIDQQNASSVTVAGEFNAWDKDNIYLEKNGNRWQKKLELPIDFSKFEYQFKFVVNGKDWILNNSLPISLDKTGIKNNSCAIPNVQSSTAQIQQNNNFSLDKMAKSSRGIKGENEEKVYEDIRYARMMLNRVHEHCNRLDAQVYLHQQADDVLVVTRQLEMDMYQDFDAYVSITRFCFYNKGGEYLYKQSITLPGFMTEVVYAGFSEIPDSVYQDSRIKDPQHIYGPRGCKIYSYNYLEGKFCSREKVSELNEKLNFFFMPPGFTCVIKVKTRSGVKDAVSKINRITTDNRLQNILDSTPESGINHILFRCDPEEKDISKGARGPYGLKEYGQFPYAGLASLFHMLKKTKLSKDMGSEIFDNMRNGDWLLDYCANRITQYNSIEPSIQLKQLGDFFTQYVDYVKQVPAHMKPKYGGKVLETIYNRTVQEVFRRRMKVEFLDETVDFFIQKLALAVYQMHGRVPSVYFKEHKDSLCAGLTHFSTGYMRCWGRDTFISLRGLLIITGLEKEARDNILFFAKVYRHGLLPNLHDGGGNTRFNSRDAPWFFLQAIKDYCIMSQEKENFLNQRFELHFKDDDQEKHLKAQKGRNLSVLDLIIEIVQRHAQGIEFREWNAGTKIDAHMKDAGFNIKITCDIEKTGFCFGGNRDNCGTWMDKMGSSEFGGNKGKPATPRDGAPIELVAMQYSILTWLNDLNQQGIIKQSGVRINRNNQDVEVKFGDWADKMQQNFERCFWIPHDKSQDKNYDVNPSLINRRGIYKDVYGSIEKFTEYQFRPNICIAMSYAPELFEQEHAAICLQNVADILMEKNCMGIKTLDPKDKQYNGDYVNSDASHGWNYHQGPEWVWPVGFFLKAQLIFKEYSNSEEAINDTMKWLIPHKEHILKDRWQGLPELTNSHGKICVDSCVTQAWSISTILDAMRDLYYYQKFK